MRGRVGWGVEAQWLAIAADAAHFSKEKVGLWIGDFGLAGLEGCQVEQDGGVESLGVW